MALYEMKYKLIGSNRNDIRQELTELFLKENAGTGKGESSSKYNYYVETYNEYSIILKRPAILNKGFDFTVNVNNFYFKTTGKRHRHPKHEDIFIALEYAKKTYPCDYKLIIQQIENIFNLQNYDLNSLDNINFKDADGIDRPIAIILLALKWLFIEQDITYWNWSGRNKLYEGLSDRGLI